MLEQRLKYRTTGVIIGLLFLAMALQTVVVMFLNLRDAVDREIAWTKLRMEQAGRMSGIVASVGAGEESLEKQLLKLIYDAECTTIFIKGNASAHGSCNFGKKLADLTKQAFEHGVTKIDHGGIGWHLFSLRSDAILVSVPVMGEKGEPLAALGVEHSLVPIYSKLGTTSKISLVYLFLNLIIFATIGFFRMAKLIFRPMDKLVGLAESYRPQGEAGWQLTGNLGVFRTLSTSLNSMLSRIESDNRKLRASVEELEKLNRELVENQNLMIRSEKLASIGRLSAGLAHEIGNPLAIIQGYLELLDRHDLDPDERHLFAEKAGVELERLKKLIRQMLSFARPVDDELESLDIHKRLDEVVEFVNFEKKSDSFRVMKNYNALEATIVSDPHGIRQVVLNCLLNAFDAIQETGQEENVITITTTDIVGNGAGGVRISIVDTGCGIPEENLANLFDPFYTTKEAGRGTGLGLFVCHTIMEKLEGRIEMKNSPAGGAEVVIELPKK